MQLFHVLAFAATLFVGAVAQIDDCNPLGLSCDTPGEYDCAQDPDVNNGNAFIYQCDMSNTFVYIDGCACPGCCKTETSGSYCT